ncbi:MAG: hypothetical protein EBT40_00370 [Betaproteobacteria bacterium]|nr:hypothetical protein [Betaproteobacteria bacterium]
MAAMLPAVAVHAQSCVDQFVPNSSMQDFADHGDGTLTDRRTGLTWSRCSAGQSWQSGSCVDKAAEFDWTAAESYVREVNERGGIPASTSRRSRVRLKDFIGRRPES